jgi:hypothetical protein
MSNSLKVLTVLLYISLHTIICTRTELLNDTGNAQFLYHGTVQCLSSLKKIFLEKMTGTLCSEYHTFKVTVMI